MAKSVKKPVLNERAQVLLRALVTRYIRDGQPVGSRTLAQEGELELSPASIRNVMADLEDMGLIKAPHTSAGRVPTVQGYRVFVDTLLKIEPLTVEATLRLQREFMKPQECSVPDTLLQVSSLLSEITHLAGVVMLPKRESQALRHVEFLPLSDRRVLVILVVNEEEVQNRIIYTSRQYQPAELQQAANYLNAAFAGKDIQQVRNTLLNEMRDARCLMDSMMQMTIEVADKAFVSTHTLSGDYVLSGQTNLMNVAELSDVDKLRQLFAAFNQKRDILHLLDQAVNAQGVQIFIGEESGYDMLDAYSIVTAPYQADGAVVGVLGVIGPTRMAYDRIIPIVDITARLLGATLGQH